MEYKTDSLLVHLARAGDEDACEKLVKKYYSSIYQYCLLHINDPYEAEDLTQEVFTRFFSNLYRYKEYGKVKNYLYTIAGNTVKNYYKKKKDIPSEELLQSLHTFLQSPLYIPLFVAYNSSSFFTSNSFIKSSFALPIRYFTRESLI